MWMPDELFGLFEESHFKNYPFVTIPQTFSDERGWIANIADGDLGDVAYITSVKGAIRANHVHAQDWHLSFMISGSMHYSWESNDKSIHKILVSENDLIYTPPQVPHRMEFLENSKFIAIAKLRRSHLEYEADTQRLPNEFFRD